MWAVKSKRTQERSMMSVTGTLAWELIRNSFAKTSLCSSPCSTCPIGTAWVLPKQSWRDTRSAAGTGPPSRGALSARPMARLASKPTMQPRLTLAVTQAKRLSESAASPSSAFSVSLSSQTVPQRSYQNFLPASAFAATLPSSSWRRLWA